MADSPEYAPGRGYNGGRSEGFDESTTIGDLIRQRKGGFHTKSLWQGRQAFLQTSGNENRSIMPSTVVPRGSARGPGVAQLTNRVMGDWIKSRMGVPDISLSGWGGEGGYKFRDVVGAVKARNAGTDFRFNQPTGPVQGPLKPPMGLDPPRVLPRPSGGGPAAPAAVDVASGIPTVGGPVRVGNMNWYPNGGASTVIGGAQRVLSNPTVQAAARGAVGGAVKGAWAGPMGMVVGAVRGGAKAAPTLKTASGKPVGPITVNDSWRPPRGAATDLS